MKNIVEVCKEVTAQLVIPTDFTNCLTSEQNIQAEAKFYPCNFLIEPIVSNHEVSASMNLNETYPLVLMFLSNDALEDTQQQHDVIIYERRTQAKEFIKKLLAYVESEDAPTTFVKEITGISITNVINATSQNLTGVQLEMSVEVYDRQTVC